MNELSKSVIPDASAYATLMFASLDQDQNALLPAVYATIKLDTESGLDFILCKLFLEETRQVFVFGGRRGSASMQSFRFDLELSPDGKSVKLAQKTEVSLEELA